MPSDYQPHTSPANGLPPTSELSILTLTSSMVFNHLHPSSQSQPFQFGPSRSAASHQNTFTDTLKADAYGSLGSVPRQELRYQIEQLPASQQSGRTLGERIIDLILGSLHNLADRYLEWRGNRLFLVANRRLEFQALLGRLVPEQIAVVSQMTSDLNPNSGTALPSLREIENSRQRLDDQPLIPIPAGTYLRELADQRLPDLHRHHNGSTYPLLLWPRILKSADAISEHVENEDVNVEFRRRIFELADAFAPNSRESFPSKVGRLLDAIRRLRAELFKYVRRTEDRDSTDTTEPPEPNHLEHSLLAVGDAQRYLTLTQEPAPRNRPMTDYIGEASGKMDDFDDTAARERRFLVRLIHCLARERVTHNSSNLASSVSEDFARAAYGYLILQNRVLNALVQPADDAEGLARFVYHFFDHPFREVTETRDDLRLSQASRSGAVDWLELRQSPSGDPLEKLRRPLQASARLRQNNSSPQSPARFALGRFPNTWLRDQETYLQPDRANDVPGVATIFHFIRTDDSADSEHWQNRIHDGSRLIDDHRSIRNSVEQNAYQLRRAASHPDRSPYFVGLDVAALETAAPIGVFAPAIRWLRSPSTNNSNPLQNKRTLFQNQYTQSLGVTCHAGEDFRHLIGGLRSIDESIEFLEMKRGDRIGHGLALGVRPDAWSRRLGGQVTMSIGRRFFDLIWFHGALTQFNKYAAVAEQVRREIDRLSRQLYEPSPNGNISNPPPSVPSSELLDASRRFQKLDPRLLETTQRYDSYRRFARQELERARNEHGREPYVLWRLHMTDDQFGSRAKTVEQFPIRSEWFEAIKFVQRKLLDKLTSREIAIEVNPTSNRAIGGLDCLSEHPIFRWSPPGTTPADHDDPYIVVGTDDPGVFGSELLHEYAFLHAAAQKLDHDRRDIERWLDNLRQTGMRFLFMRDN